MKTAQWIIMIIGATALMYVFNYPNKKVVIETNQGNIVIELFVNDSPISTKNFLHYVKEKHYNDTIFHRVIPGFMIQGGGLNKNLIQKQTNPAIINEAYNGLKNTRGTIGVARTDVIDSGTDQFYINLVDNEFLDYKNDTPSGHGYAVFGKVIKGLDVIDKISNIQTEEKSSYKNLPTEIILISGWCLLS